MLEDWARRRPASCRIPSPPSRRRRGPRGSPVSRPSVSASASRTSSSRARPASRRTAVAVAMPTRRRLPPTLPLRVPQRASVLERPSLSISTSPCRSPARALSSRAWTRLCCSRSLPGRRRRRFLQTPTTLRRRRHRDPIAAGPSPQRSLYLPWPLESSDSPCLSYSFPAQHHLSSCKTTSLPRRPAPPPPLRPPRARRSLRSRPCGPASSPRSMAARPSARKSRRMDVRSALLLARPRCRRRPRVFDVSSLSCCRPSGQAEVSSFSPLLRPCSASRES